MHKASARQFDAGRTQPVTLPKTHCKLLVLEHVERKLVKKNKKRVTFSGREDGEGLWGRVHRWRIIARDGEHLRNAPKANPGDGSRLRSQQRLNSVRYNSSHVVLNIKAIFETHPREFYFSSFFNCCSVLN